MITLRASSLARYEACPASYHLEQGQPELPSQAVTESGNRVHAWLADCRSVELDGEEQDLAEDMLEGWTVFVQDMPPTSQTYVEKDFSLAIGEHVITGHPDRVEIRGTVATLADWKTGYLEVTDAEENLQLLAYGLMTMATHPEVESIHCYIAQPRVRGGGSHAVYNRAELRDAYLRIVDIIEAIEEASEPKPSTDACRYCRAQTICPAIRREVARVEKLDLSAQRWEAVPVPEKMALWDKLGAVEKAIGHMRALFRADLERDPNAYGGELRLKPGAVKATITDPTGLFRALVPLGVTSEEYLAAVSVAKTKLAPIVKAKAGKKGKEFDAFFEQTLKPYVEEKQNASSVERRKA